MKLRRNSSQCFGFKTGVKLTRNSSQSFGFKTGVKFMRNSQSFGFKTEAKLSEFLRIFAKFSPVLKPKLCE